MNPIVALVVKHELVLAFGVGATACLLLASLQVGWGKSILTGVAALAIVILGITEVLPEFVPGMHDRSLAEIVGDAR